MSGNYFCHVCGGLVDLIKLQPSDIRLCECEKRFARLRAENNRLKAELAEAKKDAERWKYARRKICFTGNGDGTCMMHGINLPAAIPGWPDPGKVAEFCDAAIDAAMKGK